MLDKEKILQLVGQKGPCIPTQLTAELSTNTLILGAILSELAKEGRLKLSHTKIGGSPAYYLQEQQPRLQELYPFLNEKDRRTYDLLKQELVLRDEELEPLTRVSLGNIKDFAVPLQVSTKEKSYKFWKWFLMPDAEAEMKIKAMLGIGAKKPQEAVHALELPKAIVELPIKAAVTMPVEKLQETKKAREPKKQKPQETQQELNVPEQKEAKEAPKDDLFDKTTNYFKQKGITLQEFQIIRKNSELEGIAFVPSSVGGATYFCKAKAKKRCNDGELASAFVQGQTKGLPVLFLYVGELTKKAQEQALKFRNFIVDKLEG